MSKYNKHKKTPIDQLLREGWKPLHLLPCDIIRSFPVAATDNTGSPVPHEGPRIAAVISSKPKKLEATIGSNHDVVTRPLVKKTRKPVKVYVILTDGSFYVMPIQITEPEKSTLVSIELGVAK